MTGFPALRFIAISAAVVLVFCGGEARAEKRVALVVGNSKYEKLVSLVNPVNDARLISSALTDLGFSLIGAGAQLDLDKAGFDNAVQQFGRALEGADVALFYYAGHGVEVKGTNYLIPVGANPTREGDVDFELISANLVLRQMQSAQTKLNLIILDACRNNPLAGRSIRSGGGGLAVLQGGPGTLISYSTQPGNVAQDGVDGNSPYTKALEKTIRRPGLGLFDVFNEIGLLVLISSDGVQQPWQSSSPISASFYFSGQPSQTGTHILPAPDAPKTAIPPPDVKNAAVAPPAATRNDSRKCNSDGGDYIVKNVKFSDPAGGLVVRNAPRASAEGLGVIPPEATGVAVDNCQGSWCQVRYSCLSGWSSASFLDQRSRNLYRVVGVSASDRDGLNMRISPGYSSSKTGAIPYNANDVVMHACERVPNDQTWCLATFNGRSGWVAQRFLARAE